jgi:acetyl-CoA C-acetyltransferase
MRIDGGFKMNKVVIVSAKRSAIGNFGGVYKDVSAVELGVQVLKGMFSEINLDPRMIDEVIIGNVLNAGLGQNVARQVAVKSGIPVEVPAYVVNKVCGSGMKAVSLAADMIKLGEAEIVVAGGIENMSQCPYVMKDMRWGARMGDKSIVDLMVADGLTDVFNDYHMGITAENLAEKWSISKEEQDLYATESQNKAEKAMNEGKFKDEIVNIVIPQKKGDAIIIDTDEYPKKGVTVDSLTKLRPAFKNDGTVTAGNASGINDGAALMILMSEKKAKELGLEIFAYMMGCTSAGVEPSIMGYGPVPAIKKLLTKLDLKINDIELAELNEAFAAQSLSVMKGLTKEIGWINPDIVNVNGGAISLGHPIGASGTRIIVTLLHEMKRRGAKRGLAGLCIGGGMGIASIFER